VLSDFPLHLNACGGGIVPKPSREQPDASGSKGDRRTSIHDAYDLTLTLDRPIIRLRKTQQPQAHSRYTRAVCLPSVLYTATCSMLTTPRKLTRTATIRTSTTYQSRAELTINSFRLAAITNRVYQINSPEPPQPVPASCFADPRPPTGEDKEPIR
jgi:hypothetical protein